MNYDGWARLEERGKCPLKLERRVGRRCKKMEEIQLYFSHVVEIVFAQRVAKGTDIEEMKEEGLAPE
jgi:hypothetical protein